MEHPELESDEAADERCVGAHRRADGRESQLQCAGGLAGRV